MVADSTERKRLPGGSGFVFFRRIKRQIKEYNHSIKDRRLCVIVSTPQLLTNGQKQKHKIV